MPSEWLVNEGELIVIGTIVDALPPRWGTPDGLPPPDPVAAIQRGMRIITSYVLEVEGEPIVNRLSSTETDERLMPALALATLGGQIDGLAYYDSYPTRHFEIGERALVVLHSSAQRTTGVDVMTPYGPAWDVRHKYVLDRYSQALSFAGQIREPADDLIARIREADERIPLAAPERPPPPRSQ